MTLSWPQRLTRLSKILGTNIITDDEERQGQALDAFLTSHTKEDQAEVESLRFTNSDLSVIGKLADGQFGTVEIVRCRLDSRVYARKTMEKRTALKARGQCSPQYERDMLIKALKTNSLWAPHLLCAFQTEATLQLVMQYADGGNLWDVIEYSLEGKIPERDLRWWMPQMVSAIEWCHSQGFAHRDVKPHNFVLTPTSHLLLIDFGSAAPLLPPSSSGTQLIPKEHCVVPCGTIDYISPEILQCHEEALVALELTDDATGRPDVTTVEGYGRETDWWSFAAMVYEMGYGIAPFFANDVGRTYMKIVNHRTSLKFDRSANLSHAAISLLQGMLCDKETRFGRHSVTEIKDHAFFRDVDWTNLHAQKAPADLRLPQFTYSAAASDLLENYIAPPNGTLNEEQDAGYSQAFAFSALFQSSVGMSSLQGTPTNLRPSLSADRELDSFAGFSWGPRLSAFSPPSALDTSLPLHREPVDLTPRPSMPARATDPLPLPDLDHIHPFRTPIRPASVLQMHGHTLSIPRTGTARRMQGRRPVSDREAMQQLVDCVGMSARKKVLESGKKPRYITAISRSGQLGFRKDNSHFSSIAKPLIGERGDLSATTSETGSEPPSPTPRPGSALSRRSGWGGRSTPSLMAGRSTPTLSFSATGSKHDALGSANSLKDSAGQITPLEDSKQTGLFGRRLREAEGRHNKLLDELSALEDDMDTISLRLKRT